MNFVADIVPLNLNVIHKNDKFVFWATLWRNYRGNVTLPLIHSEGGSKEEQYALPGRWKARIHFLFGIIWFLQRGRLACNAERCNTYSNSVCPSVRLSHAGTLSRRMNIGSRGLHCEVAKTLWFSDTNNGWGRRPLPPKICAQSDPPPLKCADFDQYLLITSPP